MTVAKVIVDVPAKQTDRPFDYLIPEELEDVIQPGMRVIVPFGPRKVQGFVESIEESSSFKSLKKNHRTNGLSAGFKYGTFISC